MLREREAAFLGGVFLGEAFLDVVNLIPVDVLGDCRRLAQGAFPGRRQVYEVVRRFVFPQEKFTNAALAGIRGQYVYTIRIARKSLTLVRVGPLTTKSPKALKNP